MRLYVPSTLSGLARIVTADEVGPAPLDGYAVTQALREELDTEDLEELEYEAMSRAADASLEMFADEPRDAKRRLVLAADMPDTVVRAGTRPEAAAVLIDQSVPYEKIVSAHVDEPEAGVDAELLWYARQELPGLVEAAQGERR